MHLCIDLLRLLSALLLFTRCFHPSALSSPSTVVDSYTCFLRCMYRVNIYFSWANLRFQVVGVYHKALCAECCVRITPVLVSGSPHVWLLLFISFRNANECNIFYIYANFFCFHRIVCSALNDDTLSSIQFSSSTILSSASVSVFESIAISFFVFSFVRESLCLLVSLNSLYFFCCCCCRCYSFALVNRTAHLSFEVKIHQIK